MTERAPAGRSLPARLRVLHLEDDPADAELIHAALEAEGMAVDARRVDTSEAFLRAIEEDTFDLVLSDYALPSFDGISAVRELRRRKVDVPLIIISGTLGEDRAVEALKAGATDFVVKQHLSRLGPAVARALEEARERGARRRAEEELAESRRFLQRVIDATPNLIYVFDLAERRNVYINPQSVTMLGYTPEEIESFGSGLDQLEHAAICGDLPALVALWEEMRQARDGQVMESEYRVRLPSGEWRWLRSRRVPFKRVEGEVRQILGAAEDVTDHKRAERRRAMQYAITVALAESESWPEAARRVVATLGEALDWPVVELWMVDPSAGVLRLDSAWHHPSLGTEGWRSAVTTMTFAPGPTLPGRVWASGRPAWVEDIAQDPFFMRPGLAQDMGLRSAVGAPVRAGRDVCGVLKLLTRDPCPPDHDLMEGLEAVGRQMGEYRLRNVRGTAMKRNSPRQATLS